jgi:hypothetical protein
MDEDHELGGDECISHSFFLKFNHDIHSILYGFIFIIFLLMITNC